MPYLILAAVCLAVHGFLLTNDGVIWDGWYFLSWLRNRNWGAFDDYAWSQGMPFSLLVLKPLAIFPDIVLAGMIAIVGCLWLQGVLIYRLARKLAPLTRSEALALAVLYQSCPIVSSYQDFPILTLVFYQTLFFAGVLAAAAAMESTGWPHWLLRIGAVAALMMSCWTNGSLLVVYGSAYVAWFCLFRRREGMTWAQAISPFLRRYPDLLVLPPATFWARNTFSPQFGWFEDYNKPTTDPATIWKTFWSFFETVVPYHVQKSAEWILDHPFLAFGLVVFLFLWPRLSPVHWAAERSGFQARHLGWFALLSFFLGILPLAIIGKMFLSPVFGEFSRWSMHVPLPFALVTLAVLRGLCFPRRRRVSRWFPAVVACSVVVLGSQVLPVYVGERAQWVLSRALLHNATRSAVVRESSVVVTTPFSLSRQDVYGIYAFGDAFGEQKRLVLSRSPNNGAYFEPSEIVSFMLPTALVPNEFRRVDPAGQQVFIEPDRNRQGLSDWDLAWRYLRLRWFGPAPEMDDFLTRLCPIAKWRILKSRTPFPEGEPLPPPQLAPHPRDLTNGAGIEMIFLRDAWWVGRFEVTQAQYSSLMSANPSLFKDPYRPVECVSWHEAMEFCRRLTEMERVAGRLPEGLKYRLPTLQELSDLGEQEPRIPAVLTYANRVPWYTARVGSMPPNPLRLHDLKGNVWEWCMDWWDREERFKLSKGGAWVNGDGELQFYQGDARKLPFLQRMLMTRLLGPYRRDLPDQAFWDRGFRVVLAAPAPPQREWAIDREPWRQKR